MDVIVIGAGIAGVAAAIAARQAGATVMVIEQRPQPGGVAVVGQHRTICGLSAIDAPTPELLEPGATAWWLPRLCAGAPFQRGRVWLWPTSPTLLSRGLGEALSELHIPLHLASTPSITADGVVTLSGEQWQPTAVIDASGSAWWKDAASRPARQCGAWRVTLHLQLDESPGAQRAALRRLAHLAPVLALEKITTHQWQLSIDASEQTAAIAIARQAAVVLGATIQEQTTEIAERDHGGYPGLSLEELFACRERGLAWAAWPSEAHDAQGVHWQWPAADRYGCPESLSKPSDAPAWLWCCGKGLAATPAAAAALRVIGTGLALGHAVGTRVLTA